MRVMTVGAGDRTFPDRMSIRLVDFHFFPQVTAKTDIRLAYGIQHHVLTGMHTVAGYAAQLLAGMDTGSPIYVIALVTGQTDITLCFSARVRLRAKTYCRHFTRVQRVLSGRAVTRLTSLVGCRCSSIGGDKVGGFQYSVNLVIVVALETGFFTPPPSGVN